MSAWASVTISLGSGNRAALGHRGQVAQRFEEIALGRRRHQRGWNALAHDVRDDHVEALVLVPEEIVEVAVDPLRRNGERRHLQSGNVRGRLREQQHLLDSEPELRFPIAGGFEVGGSRADALLELGIQRADLLLRSLLLGSGAKRRDAVAQVAGQLAQQRHLFVAERVGLRRVDAQRARELGVDHERNRNHRGVPALERLGAPRGERRIGGRVLHDLLLSRPDARPRRSPAAVGVGPAHVDGLQVALVDSGLRHGRHGLRLVVFRTAHPAEAIARLVDDDAADLIEPGGFVRGADQGLVAAAQRPVCAIDPEQLLLRAFAFGDVLNGADAFHRAPVLVELDLRPFSNPFQRASDDDAVLDVIRGTAHRGGPGLVDGFLVRGMNRGRETTRT